MFQKLQLQVTVAQVALERKQKYKGSTFLEMLGQTWTNRRRRKSLNKRRKLMTSRGKLWFVVSSSAMSCVEQCSVAYISACLKSSRQAEMWMLKRACQLQESSVQNAGLTLPIKLVKKVTSKNAGRKVRKSMKKGPSRIYCLATSLPSG